MKRVKFWKILLVMASVLFILVGCREADKVNANISKQADYFECERKIAGSGRAGGRRYQGRYVCRRPI